MAENKNASIDGEQDAKAAYKANEACYFCWLFASCKYAIEQAEKYNHEYDKYRDVQCPMKMWPSQPSDRDRLLLLVVVALCVSTLVAFYKLEFFHESNRAVAAFTAVLTAIAIVQWWTTRRQWQVAQAQSATMMRQAEQTERMIEQSRIAQRSWLWTDSPSEPWVVPGSPIKLRIPVHNSGQIPGTVSESTIRVWIRPKNVDAASIAYEFDKLGFEDSQRCSIAPKGHIEMAAHGDETLADGAVTAFYQDSTKLYVLCKFAYVDDLGTADEVKAMYIFDAVTERFVLNGDYH